MDRESRETGRERLNSRIGQRLADRILVVDHKSKMAALISWLSTALLQELVAHIDEGRCPALAPKFEIEPIDRRKPEPLRYHRLRALRG